MHIIKRIMIAVISMILIVFGMVGCMEQTTSNTPPTRLFSKSLDDIGFSLEDRYGEQAAALYHLPVYCGIEQLDAQQYGGAEDYGDIAPGNYTYLSVGITNRDAYTVGEASFPLMSLRAYEKAKMADAVVQLNYKDYTFEELTPYILFETEEYIIYDFMFFESDEAFAEFAEREYRTGFEDAYNVKYNPEYLEHDYVKLMVDVRSWLIEQIKADFPQ